MVELAGRAGSGRKREFVTDLLPDAPRKKYAVRGNPSLRLFYISLYIYIFQPTPVATAIWLKLFVPFSSVRRRIATVKDKLTVDSAVGLRATKAKEHLDMNGVIVKTSGRAWFHRAS